MLCIKCAFFSSSFIFFSNGSRRRVPGVSNLPKIGDHSAHVELLERAETDEEDGEVENDLYKAHKVLEKQVYTPVSNVEK